MVAKRCSTWMKHFTVDSVAEKKHLQQLSRGCYVYGRDGDADDTLIIRDFYTTDKFVVFGVKSVEKIEKMYAAIWDVIAMKKRLLLPLDANLKHVICRDYSKGDAGNEVGETDKIVEVKVVGVNMCVMLHKNEAAFALYNLKTNGLVDCGVILDLPDMLKLCTYLQKRFKFYNFMNCKCINKYSKDDFF